MAGLWSGDFAVPCAVHEFPQNMGLLVIPCVLPYGTSSNYLCTTIWDF